MKLKPQTITKLARSIYAKLVDKKLITILSSDKKVFEKIESIILADAKAEEDIDGQAKKMMETFRAQIESGEIEYNKMYVMIKKQLCKEKKFVV